MIVPRRTLSRRALLRGASATLALPWLEAMGRAGQAPRRLVFLYVPNGKIMSDWSPRGTGTSFELGPTMAPLAPFRSEMTILSGLCHRNGEALGDGPGDHARAAGSYLTGVHPKKSASEARLGVSIDQLAAAKIGHLTRLPSLELSCDRGQTAGACDSGYNCAYQATLSWRNETTPQPVEVDPRQVFDRLFGRTGEDAAARARRQRDDASVLDFVAEDARRLGQRVGASDRQKLDEYFTSVRDVELRLARLEERPPPAPPRGARRPTRPSTFGQHLQVMSELLTLALATDSTRIVTFMWGREVSNRAYPDLGSAEGHHDLSHHQNDAEKIEILKRIDRFHVEQLAAMLTRLAAVKEGDGTLLDHAMVVYGSGLSDGNRHLHVDLPTIVFGRGAGALRPGRHVQHPERTPMCNLWLTLARRLGVELDRFGDSTGALPLDA